MSYTCPQKITYHAVNDRHGFIVELLEVRICTGPDGSYRVIQMAVRSERVILRSCPGHEGWKKINMPTVEVGFGPGGSLREGKL